MSHEDQMVEKVKRMGHEFLEIPFECLIVDARDLIALELVVEELADRPKKYEAKYGPLEDGVGGGWFPDSNDELIEIIGGKA